MEAANTLEPGARLGMVRAQWRAAIRQSDLPSTSRLLALTLAEYMKPNGRCWPSIAELKAATGLARWTIQRHIGVLYGAGWIRLERETEWSVWTYSAAFSGGASQDGPGAIMGGPGAILGGPGASQGGPEPVVEPVVEPEELKLSRGNRSQTPATPAAPEVAAAALAEAKAKLGPRTARKTPALDESPLDRYEKQRSRVEGRRR